MQLLYAFEGKCTVKCCKMCNTLETLKAVGLEPSTLCICNSNSCKLYHHMAKGVILLVQLVSGGDDINVLDWIRLDLSSETGSESSC